MKARALVLCLLIAPLAAMAQPARVFISPSGEPFRASPGAPDGFETWFARLDAKHAGRIDREAFRADAVRYFKVLDVNGDGVIDGFEVAAYEKSVAAELDIGGQGFSGAGAAKAGVATLLAEPEPVSGADVNLDSRITMTEWLAAADRRFDMLDPKHLGYLTHDALKALLPKSRGK